MSIHNEFFFRPEDLISVDDVCSYLTNKNVSYIVNKALEGTSVDNWATEYDQISFELSKDIPFSLRTSMIEEIINSYHNNSYDNSIEFSKNIWFIPTTELLDYHNNLDVLIEPECSDSHICLIFPELNNLQKNEYN